jgi:hypothetical protein
MHNKIKIPTKSKPKKSIIRIYCPNIKSAHQFSGQEQMQPLLVTLKIFSLVTPLQNLA